MHAGGPSVVRSSTLKLFPFALVLTSAAFLWVGEASSEPHMGQNVLAVGASVENNSLSRDVAVDPTLIDDDDCEEDWADGAVASGEHHLHRGSQDPLRAACAAMALFAYEIPILRWGSLIPPLAVDLEPALRPPIQHPAEA